MEGNLKRFKDKINYLDSSFCTTDPKSLILKIFQSKIYAQSS